LFTHYLVCIDEDRPISQALHNHVVQEAAVKWRDLGVQLLDPANESMLDIIEKDHPQDALRCCQCMLQKWLQTNTDASWGQLLEALRSPCIQLMFLADKIESTLIVNKKCKIFTYCK